MENFVYETPTKVYFGKDEEQRVGKILKEFYDTEEWKEMKQYPYVMWEEEKEKIFSLVNGKKTPLSFQFVMMLKPDLSPEFLVKYNLAVREDEIAGLFINILYDRQGLKCTSGVSRKTFVLDKTLEEAEITAAMDRILSGLEELGIELRK